jgi:DNA-binding GntR family transcriptional regulator
MLQWSSEEDALETICAMMKNRGPGAANHRQEEGLSRGALRHELAKRLLAEIFQGELPAGARLIILNLAERFGLSSTPVREALLELEANGMVEFVHNRGAIVKPFGPDQLREIFHLRRILETEAARLACGRIDRARLVELRGQFAKMAGQPHGAKWLEREMLADRDLHAMICENCGSTRLMEDIFRYDTLVQALRDVVGNRRRAIDEAVKEHTAVIDALLAGNPDDAARAMAQHIDRAAKWAEAAMFGGK